MMDKQALRTLFIFGYLVSSSGACRSDYTRSNEICYKQFSDNVTWQEADKKCSDDHAALLRVDDNNSVKLLRSLMPNGDIELWVGARKTANSSTAQWNDGTNVSSELWNYGEPNHVGGVEDCVEAANYKSGLLNVVACDARIKFICQGKCRSGYTQRGSVCYKFFEYAVRWHDADRKCTEDSAFLIKMDDEDSFAVVKSITIEHGRIWVGARTKPNSRNFQWKDGTNVSQYWNHDEPNNNYNAFGIDEDCVEASYYINGVLNDKECSKLVSFVCQACSIPPLISNGHISLATNADQPGTSQRAHVYCDAGYNATKSEVECLPSKKWESVLCNPKDCGPTPSIQNGTIIFSKSGHTKYDDYADVTCDDGYIPKASYIRCLSTGKWSLTSCELSAISRKTDMTTTSPEEPHNVLDISRHTDIHTTVPHEPHDGSAISRHTDMPKTAPQELQNVSAISRQTDIPTSASQDAHRIPFIVAASVASVLGLLLAILIIYICVKMRKSKSSANQQNEVTERSPHTIERPDDQGFHNDAFQENQHEQIIPSDDDGYLEVTLATNMAKYNKLN